MKYRLLKIMAILFILIQLSSCIVHHNTHRHYPGSGRYRGAGRFW